MPASKNNAKQSSKPKHRFIDDNNKSLLSFTCILTHINAHIRLLQIPCRALICMVWEVDSCSAVSNCPASNIRYCKCTHLRDSMQIKHDKKSMQCTIKSNVTDLLSRD